MLTFTMIGLGIGLASGAGGVAAKRCLAIPGERQISAVGMPTPEAPLFELKYGMVGVRRWQLVDNQLVFDFLKGKGSYTALVPSAVYPPGTGIEAPIFLKSGRRETPPAVAAAVIGYVRGEPRFVHLLHLAFADCSLLPPARWGWEGVYSAVGYMNSFFTDAGVSHKECKDDGTWGPVMSYMGAHEVTFSFTRKPETWPELAALRLSPEAEAAWGEVATTQGEHGRRRPQLVR